MEMSSSVRSWGADGGCTQKVEFKIMRLNEIIYEIWVTKKDKKFKN